MSTPQIRALQTYVEVSQHNAAAHVFRAAMRKGIFAHLATGQKTLEQLSEACQTQPHATELVLDALRALKLVEKYGDDYALAQVMHLVTDYDRDQGDRYWSELESFLETGQSLQESRSEEEHLAAYRAEKTSMQWMSTPAALSAANILELGTTRQAVSILDLGAGSAVFSLSMAHSDPEATVTVVDWPEALQLAIQNADQIGLSERFRTIPGDYRTVELPEAAFDIVVTTQIVHLQSDDQLRHLLQRVRHTLKPGGELVIVDVFPGQDDGQLTHAVHNLEMALRVEHGRPFDPATLQQTLAALGFSNIQYSHLPDPPHLWGMIVCQSGANPA